VENAGVLWITCGWQRVIRAVFKRRRKLERGFPFRPWLFRKTSIRIEGCQRPDWVETSRAWGGIYRLVDLSVLQIYVSPVIYVAPP